MALGFGSDRWSGVRGYTHVSGSEMTNCLRLVFKAHRLCVSLNSRLASNKEERTTVSGETFSVQVRG